MNITSRISYDTRARTFWTLIGLMAACLVVYMYAVDATVHNTVTRVALEQQTATLATQIGQMEFSYIDLKNNISLDLAYAKGFENVATPTYISRGAHVLSMNTR